MIDSPFSKPGLAAGVLLFHLMSPALAQVRVITYEKLTSEQVPRKVSWTNPDTSQEEMEITEMRIPADSAMKELMHKYMSDNYRRSSIYVEPRMIVLHSMDLGDMRNSLEKSSFLDRRMPKSWKTQIKAGALPSGAHFIIDRDGKIYCLTPPTLLAMGMSDEPEASYDRDNHHWLIRRHLDGNPVALGIENTTRKDGLYDDLTHEQVEANAQLIRWLLWMEKGNVTHIVSHHQFNDREQFDRMLKAFQVKLARPMYRAWTRKDVGDEVLGKILDNVGSRGWEIKSKF